MNKLLNEEYQVRTTSSYIEMNEMLKYISDNLVWLQNNVRDSRILVLQPEKKEIDGQMQLLPDGSCGTFIDVLKGTAPVEDEDAAVECYRNSNRFAVLANNLGRLEVFPTYHTAQKGLLTRRGLFCPAITGNYAITRPLPTMEETMLNDAASRCSSVEQWGVLDGGCIANASNGYVPLDALQGFQTFENNLKQTWDSVEFVYGEVSYECYLADFKINDPIAIDSLKNLLEQLGVTVDSLECYARYTTSDTTNAQMGGTIYYKLNGSMLRLAKKLGVDHKGDVSILDFDKSLENLGMLLKESEDAVERLGNIDLQFPADCLKNALIKVKLYNKQGQNAVSEAVIQKDIKTALDIVIRCSEVLNQTATNNNWTVSQIIDASEEVTKLLNAKFELLDTVSKLDNND